jgi:pilus assembly protein CpaE
LSRHDPSGLLLLTFDGGTGMEPTGIAPADIAALVRRLRATCESVVLCAGSLRHGGLLRELATSADHIELVASQSIRELEACRRLLERIGADATVADRTRLLVWDHHPSILLDGDRMAEALGLSRHAVIPVDPAQLRNALNAGRPLALDAPLSPYMQAIRRLGSFAEPTRPFYAEYADRLRGAMKRLVERRA